jgi:DNA-binding NarL/FixJ family response regulator
MIKLSLIDSHSLFRSVFKEQLSHWENMQLIISEEDPLLFIEKHRQISIDISIINFFMPKLDTENVIEQLKEINPSLKLIVLYMSPDPEIITYLINKGVNCFISKGDTLVNLHEAIEATYNNKIYKSKTFADSIYWNLVQSIKSGKDNIKFNEREKKILELLWDEKDNKQISAELFIGIRSIEKIRHELKEKVNVKTTIGLIKYALKRRIISFIKNEI